MHMQVLLDLVPRLAFLSPGFQLQYRAVKGELTDKCVRFINYSKWNCDSNVQRVGVTMAFILLPMASNIK